MTADLKLISDKLDKIIFLLEKFGEDKTPVNPPVLPAFPDLASPNKVEDATNCTKCGLALHAVMGYGCTQTNCPTGLGQVTY